MASSETPARDALLVKYLNEAYGKERQLETALQAQIGIAQRTQLKKGLQDHLKVTKAQAKGLKARIRALGGKAEESSLPGPDIASDAASAATSLANKAIAAAKGPVQALRGTGVADNQLRNVRDCYWNEAEEIAHYNVIEQVATALKDAETAKLAKTYRRQEEQMQKFLERQAAALVKEVVKEEVPARERSSGRSGSRRRTSSRSSSTSRSTASRSASSSGGSSSSRSASTAAKRSASTTAKRTSTAAKRTKTAAKRTGTAAKTTAKAASTGAKRGAAAGRTAAKRSASASRSSSTRAKSTRAKKS